MNWQLRDYQPEDEEAVRTLVLAGLEQRFGVLIDGLNPDLDDLETHYIEQGASIIVVEWYRKIIGCGMLIKEDGSDEVARIVRVSVAREMQGQGLGKVISQRLLEIAKQRGFEQVLVETNSDWYSALKLYMGLGFVETKRVDVPEWNFTEVHMALKVMRSE